MQKLSFEQQNFKPNESEHPHQLPTDVKFLNKIMELKSKQKEIAEQAKNSAGSEKEILKMELENLDNQISNYHKSLTGYNRARKTNFTENNTDIIGKDFLNSLQEFKKKRRLN